MIFTGAYGELWAADEARLCKLMFIGKNLDKAELTAGFEACKVEAAIPPAKKQKV